MLYNIVLLLMVWWCIDMKIWYEIRKVDLKDARGVSYFVYTPIVKNLKIGDTCIMSADRKAVINQVEKAIEQYIDDTDLDMGSCSDEFSLSEKLDKEIRYVEY